MGKVLVVLFGVVVWSACTAEPTCGLTSTTACGYVDDTVESSTVWLRVDDDAALELSWIPSSRSAGRCGAPTSGCYHYSFAGAQTPGTVYEIRGDRFIAYGAQDGTYRVTPATQTCPPSRMVLACEAESASCVLEGEFDRASR